jgi:hypothetical protein
MLHLIEEGIILRNKNTLLDVERVAEELLLPVEVHYVDGEGGAIPDDRLQLHLPELPPRGQTSSFINKVTALSLYIS